MHTKRDLEIYRMFVEDILESEKESPDENEPVRDEETAKEIWPFDL